MAVVARGKREGSKRAEKKELVPGAAEVQGWESPHERADNSSEEEEKESSRNNRG